MKYILIALMLFSMPCWASFPVDEDDRPSTLSQMTPNYESPAALSWVDKAIEYVKPFWEQVQQSSDVFLYGDIIMLMLE
ncbi:MAG: hypothetical protein KBB83_05990 [Alphaproteobacteria bacterium]|nr:hypothetical protein [Alphaproteobacteria bacterium]